MAQKKIKKPNRWSVIFLQLGIGAVTGLVIGIGVAFLFDRLQIKPSIWDVVLLFLFSSSFFYSSTLFFFFLFDGFGGSEREVWIAFYLGGVVSV